MKCVCERKKECVRTRANVCLGVRERVCERGPGGLLQHCLTRLRAGIRGERVCVCVLERVCVCVSVCERVYVKERERVCNGVCVCVLERECV